jgi:hypothetical protein
MTTPIEALQGLIDAREKATTGEWVHASKGDDDRVEADGENIASVSYAYPECCIPLEETDAAFIALAANFASTSAPLLLERVRVMEELIEKCHGAISLVANGGRWECYSDTEWDVVNETLTKIQAFKGEKDV